MCYEFKNSGWLDELRWMYPESICPYDGETQTYALSECPRQDMPGGDKIVCRGKIRIQDCTTSDQIKVYGSGKVPGDTYVKLAVYLENEENCAGLCRTCPFKLYTDCESGSEKPERCDDIVVDVINGML